MESAVDKGRIRQRPRTTSTSLVDTVSLLQPQSGDRRPACATAVILAPTRKLKVRPTRPTRSNRPHTSPSQCSVSYSEPSLSIRIPSVFPILLHQTALPLDMLFMPVLWYSSTREQV